MKQVKYKVNNFIFNKYILMYDKSIDIIVGADVIITIFSEVRMEVGTQQLFDVSSTLKRVYKWKM